MSVNSLPKTVTRQRLGCDLNPGPSAPESCERFSGQRQERLLVDKHEFLQPADFIVGAKKTTFTWKMALK